MRHEEIPACIFFHLFSFFLLHDLLHGFQGLFTDTSCSCNVFVVLGRVRNSLTIIITSEHIRFVLFSFFRFSLLVLGSMR